MSDQLMDGFDDCITAMMEGASLDDCLERYPEMAEELRPMLLAASTVGNYIHSIQVPRQAQAASHTKFLAGASQERKLIQPKGKYIHTGLSSFARRTVFISACLLLCVILGAYSVVHASAKSLPGDLLYGVKRTAEKARLLFSISSKKHALLEEQITQERAQEAQEITKQARTTSIEFGGQLESLEGDLGVVAGVPVMILPDTQIVGEPEIGLYIWVIGKSQSDQTIKATTIRVEGRRFRGEVMSLQKSAWHVEQSNIIVSESTHILGDPGIGDQVEVNVRILSDGQLLAQEINLISTGKKPSDTPSQPPAAAATPTPRAPKRTPTPAGTDITPGETAEPEETEIPKHHQTPEGTHQIPTGMPTRPDDKDRDRHGTPPPPTEPPRETREPDHSMREHRPRMR